MTFLAVLVVCGLLGGILLWIEIGHRIGRRGAPRAGASARGGSSTLEASAFGLMRLLVAFYVLCSRFPIRHWRYPKFVTGSPSFPKRFF